jgi:hypothetical protein
MQLVDLLISHLDYPLVVLKTLLQLCFLILELLLLQVKFVLQFHQILLVQLLQILFCELCLQV